MINVEEYDKTLVAKFKSEFSRLVSILGNGVTIEHVGSTAVPGVGGKNIVDILIGVKSLSEMKKVCETLTNSGYFFSEKSATNEYRFLASREEETRAGDFHIHLSIKGCQRYKDFILLRNFLRADKNEANKYFTYKRACQVKSSGSRKRYKYMKAKYVDALILKAREYYEDQST